MKRSRSGNGLIPACSILAMLSCTSDPIILVPDPEPLPFVSRSQGDSLGEASDPFILDRAWADGDSLRLEITHGGGCREHAFAPYVSEYMIDSHPPQVDVWLHHDAKGDVCEALIGRRLAFDLFPLGLRTGNPVILRVHPHPVSGKPPIEVRYQRPVH